MSCHLLRSILRPAWCVLLGASLLAPAKEAHAQLADDGFDPGGSWTWESLGSTPAVDTAQVAWLQQNLERAEAVTVFELIDALSSPDEAQLLGSRLQLDPSFHFTRSRRPLLDSVAVALSRRPPSGTAGYVHVAYHVQRLRKETSGWLGGLSEFTAGPLDLEPSEPSARLRVSLDFEPARSLLEVLSGRRDAGDLAVAQDPVFSALFSHRSQSFYSFAIGPEAFVEALELAASDRAIDQLYRYSFPHGLMHFADVRNRLGSYGPLLDTLTARAADIEAVISARLGPYVPASLQVERSVHFLFADGADGWAADGIAAIDLEYFRNDYPRLMRLLAHETYHAVQSEARTATFSPPASDIDASFLTTLGVLLGEGTATHVARPREVSPEEYRQLVASGTELVSRIHDALYATEPADLDLANELLSTGVRSSGPLYWLGAEMARVIEEARGRDALTQTLFGDGLEYAGTYLSLGDPSAQFLIEPAVTETIGKLLAERKRDQDIK